MRRSGRSAAGAGGAGRPYRHRRAAALGAVAAPFAGAAVLGARDGGRPAAQVSGRSVRLTFAGVLPAVAAFMPADALSAAR